MYASTATSTMPCVVTTRLMATSSLHQLRRAPRLLSASPLDLLSGRTGPTSTMPRVVSTCLPPALASLRQHACPGALARRAVRRAARRQLLHLRRASGCLGTSRGSSSTTSPRADSSSTTSPTPRVRVPQHVARLVSRLVVDFFAYVAPPGPSAPCAARRRLLRLRRETECLGTSHSSSRGSSTTSSTTPRVRMPRHVAQLIVDYFAYAVCPGASARRAARRAARCRLLRLRRTSGSLGPSCGSSSTTSTTPRVRVPRHVARLVAPLVVDYFVSRLIIDFFAYAAHLGASARRAARRRLLRLAQARRRLLRLRCTSGASARRAARRATRCRLLHLRCASGCLGTSCGSSCGSSSTT
jgi:hypothetical protein